MSSPSFSEPPDGFVSSAEACRRLGISDRTLRRRVQAGAVEGEYVPRPQGSVLYVKLPPDTAPEAASDAADAADASSEGQQAASATRQDAAVLSALLERLDSKDAALLAATERAARAEAERDAARETAADLARRLTDTERERDRLRTRRWWKPSTW
jgi:hypothetical protein